MPDGSALSYRIDVVIPAWNEASCIERCLETIFATAEDANAEVSVRVVDNGSTDGTSALAIAAGAEVITRTDCSVAELRQTGADLGSAPYIAFIDADMEVSINWMRNSLALLSDQTIVVVGCSPEIPSDAGWVANTWQLLIEARPRRSDRNWLGTSNLMVRREVFVKARGFTNSLQTGEDVDFCYKAKAFGRVVSDNSLKAIHHGVILSMGELFSKEVWRGQSNYRGVLKHGLRLDEIPSLLHPVMSLFGVIILLIGFIVGSLPTLFAGLFLVLTFPSLMSVYIAWRTRRWNSLHALLAVWGCYSAARAVAALYEFKLLMMRILRTG